MLDSCENSRTDLYSAALMYRDWGWSVLPIRGDSDPQNPKAAAVQWSVYQRHRPTSDEIDSWFGSGRFLGLGIVCGRVSRLAVLDIDDPKCAAAFADSLPDLAETFTVESGVRGLPHYYFHVSDDVQVRGQRIRGADLQFDRTYVVAPPTAIAGTQWRVVNDAQPYTLSRTDVERISRFLSAWNYYRQVDTDSERDLLSESLCVDLDAELPVLDVAVGQLSGDVLVGWYRRLAKSGRNNALFRAASLARDRGWSRQAVQALLVDVHVVQPPSGAHSVETLEQRRQEALQTIQSAFRYAIQPCRSVSRTVRGLPNAIREALLQVKQSAVARVLDGLRLAGIEAGRVITERVACQVLHVYNIGRRTIQAALKTFTTEGFAIFESPQNPPEEHADAANAEGKEQKKCLFVTGAKRVKSGRPARHYIIPDNQKLYHLLHVRPSGSDSLTPADLASPNVYRLALQRALIERRPGLYSRRWLSARLGISVWTSRRYDRQIGVNVSATYFSTRITWANIEQLSPHVAQKEGVFLETPDGKRYPPVQGLAKRLLQRHPYLIHKRQHWNYYSLDSDYYKEDFDGMGSQPALVGQDICEKIHKLDPVRHGAHGVAAAVALTEPAGSPQTVKEATTEPVMSLWVCPTCMKQHFDTVAPDACPRCGSDHWEVAAADVWRDAERCGRWWQNLWQAHKKQSTRTPFPPQPGLAPAQRKLAETLYAAVRARTPDRALTATAARQLVLDCGEVAVERALQLLDERTNVYSAAGFMISVLRGATGHSDQRQAASETSSHEDWVARLRQSPYACFYANEV